MMGMRTPETCAINKRQDNKLEKLLHLVGDLFQTVLTHGKGYSIFNRPVSNWRDAEELAQEVEIFKVEKRHLQRH